MRLTFDDTVESFRSTFRAWLGENRPSEEEMTADPAVSSAHLPGWARRWTRRMFDDGWLVPGWPPERGGRDAAPVETLVYLEELERARVPRTTNPQGLGIVAPSIFEFGTEEQVSRYAMPILRGEKSACLGMSEPGAGSDLASLSTRATAEGDGFVVNGQKVWTSGASHADFCFLFCRTDPDAPKHKGISVLLVDMDTPGVTVRPLPHITKPEQTDLNEVFFTDAVVPAANLLGQLNNGWALAGASLAHERGMVWLGTVMELESTFDRLAAEAREILPRLPAFEQAHAADQIVRCYVDVQAAKCLGYRSFAKLARGGSAPEQALMKAFCSESHRRLHLVGSELHGDGGLDVWDARRGEQAWIEQYFNSFGGTISAGTSEIQRNIIAERVLGLPRG